MIVAILECHSKIAHMTYRPRTLHEKIRQLTNRAAIVLVTGPRQAGKTSLLSHVLGEFSDDPASRVTAFDTPADIDRFRRDPEMFLADRPGVRFFDEVQHVPEIFPYLKREIDAHPRTFRYFLSGSQHFHLMKGVTESLAGRVAVLDLWPFAAQEIHNPSAAAKTVSLLEAPAELDALSGNEYPAQDLDTVVPAMLKGGYPAPVLEDAGADWFESYRKTFIQRDIRDLSQVADLGRFDRFVVLCAGRTATVMNRSHLSSAVGVDQKTIDHWLSLLTTSYQLISLPPYFENATKRIVKRPKWVFADIGLALHLQAIRSADALLNAPHFGSLFESFVLMEARKLYGHSGLPWNGHFWGAAEGAEVDLVLPVGGRAVPIEIKHAATIRADDFRGLKTFMKVHGKSRAPMGLLLSMNPRVERVAEGIYNFPLGLLLRGP